MNTPMPDRPYWWEDAQPRETPDATLPEHPDAVIVGGGYAGLGAAITLARAGREVVVLDRERPGDGASSRNGGITSGNIRHSFSGLIDKFGLERARAIYGEGVAARDDLYAFIEAEGLDCDYQPSGRFTGAMRPDIHRRMIREAELLNRHLGIKARPVARADQHRFIGSELYHGGILRPDIGGIHPARLHHEMRRVAEQAGVRLSGRTAVTGIRREKDRDFEVRTPRRTIRARHVIVATNGYTDAGLPWLRRRLVPVISEMIATEPLDAALMDTLMPGGRMYGETRQLGHYFRPSPDGTRILLGGRRYHEDAHAARAALRKSLVEIFPPLADVGLSHHWFGFVAFPMDQLPKLTVHDGVLYATGFCGSGVVWARWLGQQAALTLLGRDAGKSIFSELPLRAIPLYNGKPWFLPLMMAWYRYRDRRTGVLK